MALDEGVLVDTLHPLTLATDMSEQIQFAAARMGAQAIRGHIDDGLQLHVIVHPAPAQSLMAGEPEEFSHPALADVDALLPALDGAIGREQVRGLIPLRPIEVEAVNT